MFLIRTILRKNNIFIKLKASAILRQTGTNLIIFLSYTYFKTANKLFNFFSTDVPSHFASIVSVSIFWPISIYVIFKIWWFIVYIYFGKNLNSLAKCNFQNKLNLPFNDEGALPAVLVESPAVAVSTRRAPTRHQGPINLTHQFSAEIAFIFALFNLTLFFFSKRNYFCNWVGGDTFNFLLARETLKHKKFTVYFTTFIEAFSYQTHANTPETL